MDLIVERVDVWAASIEDVPGSLAQMLTILRKVGADFDFIVARRSPDKPGKGVVFVAPLSGYTDVTAAEDLGFNIMHSVHSVRIEGENKPGIAAELTEKLAAEGINLRGLSAAVVGTRFILYIGLDTSEDAKKVLNILQQT